MRYALIADIHGNYPALKAVIKDMKKLDIDKVILLGDYSGIFPYPNEVVEALQKMNPIAAISGNWEQYIIDVKSPKAKERRFDQFNSLVWNVDELTDTNYGYIQRLPKEADFVDENSDLKLLMTHAITNVFKDTSLDGILGHTYVLENEINKWTREEFVENLKLKITSDLNLKDQNDNSNYDIFVFGHSHIQLNFSLGNKYFINPGSCGLALDGDNRAAYSVLDIDDIGVVNVIERRVEYDINETIRHTKNNINFDDSKHWYEVMFTILRYGTEELTFLFQHINDVAKEMGDISFPYNNKVWNEAMNSWKGYASSKPNKSII